MSLRFHDSFLLRFCLSLLIISSLGLTETPLRFSAALAQRQPTQDLRTEGLRLYQEGLLRFNRGQFREALAIFQQVLEVFRSNDEQVGEVSTLSYIGLIYAHQGQYEQALASHQQALNAAREMRDRVGEGRVLDNIGQTYDSLGQYQQALTFYQQALAIAKETGDRVGEEDTLGNIGQTYDSLGQYQQALTFYQQALAIAREDRNRASEGIALNNIGTAYFRRGQYQQALESFQQALAIAREMHDRIEEGTTLNNLGQVYVALGEYQQALTFHQQSLAIAKGTGDRPSEGARLNNVAAVYYHLGQYQQALTTFQQALAIVREIRDRAGEGATLNNIGEVYREIGQYEQALTFYQQALTIAREIGNRAGERATLNNIGEIFREIEQYEQALALYQQGLAVAREMDDRAGEGTMLNNIGAINDHIERYEQAMTSYQQALVIAREIGDRAGEGITLNNIGRAYRGLGQNEQAMTSYQQALAIAREVRNRASEGISLNNMGVLLLQSNDFAAAERTLRESIQIQESLRAGLTDPDKISIFETQADTYSFLQQALIAQNKTNEALEIAERGRARAFVELMASRLSPAGAENLTAVQGIAPPTIQDIQQVARQQNATLVEYSIAEPSKLYIWVVKPNGEITFRQADLSSLSAPLAEVAQTASLDTASGRGLEQTEAVLSTLVRGVQSAIGLSEESIATRSQDPTSPTDSIDSQTFPKQLYEILIKPIADLLPTDPSDRVIFIPQGALLEVPFAALPTPNGQYLIEQHTILTAPAIQVLALTHERQQRTQPAQGVLIVGNPTMPQLPNLPLSSLPGAEQEAREIARFFNIQPMLGAQATEVAVVQQMPNAKIIHLATHGLLDSFERAYAGAIALAPTANQDGLLASSEILGLPLKADLVVLSGCDTGRGDIRGDGVVGLSRSFLTAGASSVVVSLWRVPDAPTADLMTEFYRNWQQGLDKAQALRQAMLTTMQQHPEPRDWAAFTLMGEAN